jgi:hypothetical protein
MCWLDDYIKDGILYAREINPILFVTGKWQIKIVKQSV